MEAADSTTNSSKVIVQCHDPSGLFDRVVSRLEPRLPLSKLHWKSPNRPLRSIDQLNVSFTRDDSKTDSSAGARRHQIPGLRQTPSVKVYLARCDERESYKETCRKEIKQWLKAQGISQDGKTLMKGQERHDAYEYMIVHVVLPGTAAAAQPKSSKHISIEASESTDSVNSKSKWTGKSSSTVYDKLRADFSSSSKAPFERVAQVRLTDPDNRLPAGLGPSELEEQWQDFIEKLKTAILLSFDARVSQYEEDIREREAQRQLPGWNFCTFFILKEGLARGFENVGLMDDALIIYDELDAGLDTVVQEQGTQDDSDPASALIPFSNDLKPTIRSALDNTNGVEEMQTPNLRSINLRSLIDIERAHFPFDLNRKNYQQRILTNQASALDFHIYIFTRQIQLLFRQANVNLYTSQTKHSVSQPRYDVGVIAEVCEKATSFISFASRALRRDLYTAWGGQQGLNEAELLTQQRIIGGIVGSWKWSAIIQVLADCQVGTILADVLVDVSSSSEHAVDSSVEDHNAGMNGHLNPANEDLALWVGELILMAREVLTTTIISISDDSAESDAAKGLRSPTLEFLFQTREMASNVFQSLTVYAYRCFQFANRTSASHRMLHCLAEIEVENGDLEKAVWWLEHIPDLCNLHAQSITDRVLLRLYAKCLKSQGRLNEYVTTLISLLLSASVSPIARALPQYDEQTQWVLNELVSISDQVSPMQLPLSAFVAVQSLAKHISHDTGSGGFTMSVVLSLRFNASLEIPYLRLLLNTADGKGPAEIALENTDVVLLGRSNSQVNLACDVVTEGWYNLTHLVLRLGQLELIHDFQRANPDESTKPTTLTKPFPVLVYPHVDSFIVKATTSNVVDLNQPGCLLFTVSTGSIDLDECVINLRPATAGVRLDIQSAVSVSDNKAIEFEIQHQGDVNAIVLRGLERKTAVTLEVPYSVEIMATLVEVRVEAMCTNEAGSFSASYYRSVNVNLPVSINVQDIFQLDRLFSLFTAAPSTMVPLRILKWQIEDIGSNGVRHGNSPEEGTDVFPKMPASWMVESGARQSKGVQDKIPLCVQYQNFEEAVLASVENRFRQDLHDSPISSAAELFVSHMLSQIPALWTEQDLEATVLLQECELYSYEAMDWDNTMRALDPSIRKASEEWLRVWHAQNAQIPLGLAQARVREVKLLVEMPKPSVVVSTALNVRLHRKQYLAAGETVPVQLDIDCICRTNLTLKIQFDVVSQPDTWIIGGKKRGTITAQGGKHTFDIILVPLKTGHLLLPSVEIKSHSLDNRVDNQNVHIEVESRSQAKSILIIPNLQATTIALGMDELSGRHWMIESNSRQE